MLLDNVIHAFGSVGHDTLRSVLLSASVHPRFTERSLYTVQNLSLHMRGHQVVRLFCAMYEAGMGQEDPISAPLYGFVNELRVQPVLQCAGLVATPGGHLRNLGCIDDSSWIGTSRYGIQHVASRLPLAGNLTNVFSEATKTVGLGTCMRGGKSFFGPPARAHTSISGVHPSPRQACPASCFSQTRPPQTYGLMS